jgi:hypothetical protein
MLLIGCCDNRDNRLMYGPGTERNGWKTGPAARRASNRYQAALSKPWLSVPGIHFTRPMLRMSVHDVR